MSASRILFWRHGQTAYNAALRMQGQIDIPLNEVGIAQAERAARVLARDVPDLIVASDLVRASATAAVLGAATGLSVETDARLRERFFGAFEGLSLDELTVRWPSEFETWRTGGQPEGVGMEARGDVAVRFASGVRDAVERVPDDGLLVVVAHGSCIAAGITALLGLDAEEWVGVAGLGNCHWSVLAEANRAPGWRLASHNVGVMDG